MILVVISSTRGCGGLGTDLGLAVTVINDEVGNAWSHVGRDWDRVTFVVDKRDSTFSDGDEAFYDFGIAGDELFGVASSLGEKVASDPRCTASDVADVGNVGWIVAAC